MNGPALLLRNPQNAPQSGLEQIRLLQTLFEWEEDRTSLVLEEIEYREKRGAIMIYTNPPVHQIGNPGLDAMLSGLTKLEDRGGDFLILSWPCDPVHAGGDLKESAKRLETTTIQKNELEKSGASQAQIEALYAWADDRLEKGQALYRKIRKVSRTMRTVGICGGGLRFGGSAEVNLMADHLVGDSRSGMCFSEVMIGLIPGWAGVGRAITKAGLTNAQLMAFTAKMVMAVDLQRIGIYDVVLDFEVPLPTMQKTGDRKADRAQYTRDLEAHDREFWPKLLLAGLGLATDPAESLAKNKEKRAKLANADEIAAEVSRRADPMTYKSVWGQTLKEARETVKKMGRPLAPQSVTELEALFENINETNFDEDAFVEAEKKADSKLYRDRRLAHGIQATLEQKIADFRL